MSTNAPPKLTLDEKLARHRAVQEKVAEVAKAAKAATSSTKKSIYPHARSPEAGPRSQCIAINRVNGKRCRRLVTKGRAKLCRLHLAMVRANPELEGDLTSGPQPKPKLTPAQQVKADRLTGSEGSDRPIEAAVKRGITTSLTRRHKSATQLVLTANAKNALRKLGQPYDPSAQRQDPKEVLLGLVASAWLQQQVWAAMLDAIPNEDWQWIGVTPIPGNQATSKGVRIEQIQKLLGDATQRAARISKMAIDAGIEERLVRLAEEQQALIADTVRAGLIAAMAGFVQQLHLTKAQEAQALDAALGAAANHLRRLASGAPPEVIDGVATVIDKSKKTYFAKQREKGIDMNHEVLARNAAAEAAEAAEAAAKEAEEANNGHDA